MKITKKDLVVGKRIGDYIVTNYRPEIEEGDGIFGTVTYQCLANVKTGYLRYVEIPFSNREIEFNEDN